METKKEQIENWIYTLTECNEEIYLAKWADDEWMKPSMAIDEAIEELTKLLK